MNRFLLIPVLAFYLLELHVGGQTITPRSDREAILEGMENVLLNTEKTARSYTDVSSPFLDRSVAVENDLQMEGAAGPERDLEVASLEPVVLSDAMALDIIEERFRPNGSMVIGERGVLQLASGRTIEEGASFGASIRGVSYTVEIEAVTSSGYRLRLGSATVEKTFMETKAGQFR